MSSAWLILGASSAMARSFARLAAGDGAHVILAGRDSDDLALQAHDVLLRGAASATAMAFDARNPTSFGPLLAALFALDATPSIAVFSGSMVDQGALEDNPAALAGMIADNFGGPAQLLLMALPGLIEKPGGTIVGVSSVSGDRGRRSNFGYGAPKAGFTAFLSGLRARLSRARVHVLTVKPGFVDTAMTWGLPGLFLVASPDAAAKRMWRAAKKRRNTVYVPGFWWLIMTIIRLVPDFIFKKMKF
ncbi:MAG: SDR family NAD(P)-dependent oxidoreductase [Paracoccaceae bacterium]